MLGKEDGKKGRLVNYRQWLFFLFFVLVSVGMWLINKLTQDYVATLQFTPIVFNSKLATVYKNMHDNTLVVQVKVSGFFLLKQRLTDTRDEVSIDLKDIRIAPRSDSSLHLPTALLRDRLPDYLEKDLKVLSIDPDTLYFRVYNNVNKRVPVVADLTLGFEKEYRQSGPIELLPDSVTIWGNERDLANIVQVGTNPYTHSKLNASVEGVLKVKTPRGIIIKPEKIRYIVPVDRCTEASLLLPVRAVNLPEHTSLIALPSQVQVHFTIPIHKYSMVKPADFEAVLDYNDIQGLKGRKLRVVVKTQPKDAFDVQIEPEFVEFIIQKD